MAGTTNRTTRSSVLQRQAFLLPKMPFPLAPASTAVDTSTSDTPSRKRRRVSAIATTLATSPLPEKNPPAPKEKAPASKEAAPPMIAPEAPKEKTPAPHETTTPSILLPNLRPTTTVDAATRAKYPVLAKYGVHLLDKDDFFAEVDRAAIFRELWHFNMDHEIPNEILLNNSVSRRLVGIFPRNTKNGKEDTAGFVRSATKSGMVEDVLDAIVVDDKNAAATLMCHYLAKKYTEEYMKPVPMAQEILEKEAKESIRRERRESGITFDEYQRTRWDRRYKALVAYQAEHGHCKPPIREDNGVGKFVSQQRTAYKEKRLSEERIKLLESIGFAWQIKPSPNSDIKFFKAVAAKHHFCNITAREALLLSGYTEEESADRSRMGNVRDKARVFCTKTNMSKQHNEIASVLTQLTDEGGPMAVFGSSPYYHAFVVQRDAKAKATPPDSDTEGDDDMSSGSS